MTNKNITYLLAEQKFECYMCKDTLVDYELDDQIILKYKQVRLWDKVKQILSKPVALVCSRCHSKLDDVEYNLEVAKAIVDLLSKDVEYTDDITST